MARAAAAAALGLCLLLALVAAQDLQEEYQERDNAEQLTQQTSQLSRRSAEQQLQQNQQLNQQQNQQQKPLPDRLQEPPKRLPGDTPPNNDFGIVRPQQPSVSGVSPVRPPSQPPSPRRPPAGYSPVDSFGHFKAYLKPLTWTEALMTCIADGALLAVPNSEREALALGKFYGKVKHQVKNSADNNLYFIGVNDLQKPGSFLSIRGTRFQQSLWHRWAKGEPTKIGNNEHCVLSGETGYYWDTFCHYKHAFVCQFIDRSRSSSRYQNNQQTSAIKQSPSRNY